MTPCLANPRPIQDLDIPTRRKLAANLSHVSAKVRAAIAMAAPMRTVLRSSGRSLVISTICTPRHLAVLSPAKAQVQARSAAIDAYPPPDIEPRAQSGLAAQDGSSKSSRTFFDSTGVLWVGTGGDEPPDPNKAKLGKSELHQEDPDAKMPMLTPSSTQNITRTPADSPTISTATRDPRT